ncbi:hypothetical protein SHKM778_70830 [Streptomyces sp. KM77-8]|uniref:DUF2567 domain-containing protein n=1 Tax=Streptomyces haneummycinicus TaxID=3074435 RepID=A0AAT9HTY1_9ACTN
MKTELREAAVTAVATAALGVLLGVLWWWLAPRVPLVGGVLDGNWVVYLKDSEGEQGIGVDGTFSLLALAFGAVSAAVVFLVRRRGVCRWWWRWRSGGCWGRCWRGGWGYGWGRGPMWSRRRAARAKGHVRRAVEAGGEGALLAWPFGALLVHLGLTGLFGPRDPEPFPAGPYDLPGA